VSPPIPTTEPRSLKAGDTWQWNKFFSDYPPSDGWTLTYFFKKEDASFSIVCTVTNNQYLARVDPATSGTYKPGRYKYQARVSTAIDSFIVVEDEVEVLPDPATSGALDSRTKAQKIVAALTELALRRAGGRQHVTIDGVSMMFDTQADIIKAKTYWDGVVESEQNAYRIKKGLGSRRTIRMRL
jgi:hypothetical protein